jgi:hypothetical protein
MSSSCAGVLSVADNAVQLGVDHAVGQTKSRKERSVPVPQFILEELAVQCEGRSPDDLVFSDGAYLPRPKSDGGWFAGAVKRAKVQKITPTICAIHAPRSRSAPG